MALPKSLVQPFRRNQLLIGAGWRGFFAPFNTPFWAGQSNSAVGPTILDLQFQGPFNTNNMPAGWFDLGWIKDFKITPQSKIGSIASGYRGATRAKVRGQVGEEFEFKFREFSRLALKISTGCEVFNFLAAGQASTTSPLGTSGTAGVPLGASGYQATGGTATQPGVAGLPCLFLPAGSGSLFAAGQMIVADVDYDKVSTGFIGSNGIPVYVNNAPQDVDFIRRTSDFTNLIVSVVAGPIAGIAGNQDALVLKEVFAGGGASSSVNPGSVSPAQTSKVQKITGWSSREGGTFIMDWSGLFVMDTIDGDQFAFYYPHISISQFKDMDAWSITNVGTTDETGYELDATFESLAFDDPNDGETVVGYRAYYPSANTGVPI
jgi:hypothetical protein